MRKTVALVCGVLVLAVPLGCTADTTAAPPPGPPFKVTQEQLERADPCALFDARALGTDAGFAAGREFTQCSLVVGKVLMSVSFEPGLSPGAVDLASRSGIPVKGVSRPGEDACFREVLVTDSAVVRVSATSSPVDMTALCNLSDRVIDQVIGKLVAGGLAPLNAPAGSLAHLDACALDGQSVVDKVSDIDKSVRYRGFNGQVCIWGATPRSATGTAHFAIEFVRGSWELPVFTREDSYVIAGHEVIARSLKNPPGVPPGCQLEVLYRSAVESSTNTKEVVLLQLSSSQATEGAECAAMPLLATPVIQRLTKAGG
ncbi:hypothetical protein ACFCV3_29365 [Kribbella sp. NPDC056345]|uniref:hypothetical protein n=1 Tax=Kribbella sp. NPDC056345 TaxID=3345789 RepID=UPI0035DC9B44